ncbi:hypothetical protein OB69_12790 [Roseivirga seohaensis subsp. aquiponti]|uniref:DNA primase n=1 Tax=Roseivirga seohaensis subsp. aquiponti TaxID=1566026 RepID=A0A0L8AJ85_9BACT|nr:DNA primase [Roseivirga seohaensis]KOF02297.1 hypothetical protein OB69_12790 [Roseivirga seohaensis subsp. aquiponti]
MAISDSTIQEIKNRIDIVEVISDFVSLKKVGSNYRALSPFTNEKSPSFYVSPSKDIFKCFSSGKGGDAIAFVMEVEGINYIEALKYLANKYGIEVQEEEQTDEQITAQNERDSLFIALKFAGEFFQDVLWNHSEGKSIGLSYFKERGFSEATIKKFDLGYSLDAWDGLMKPALEKGYSEEILEKAGLILKSENKTYDRFRGRVMFPIHNVGGKVIAFGARTLRKDKKQPKYINSPETGVYHKSDIVYGIHQARQAIRNEDLCYLVEGYTDVISMHQSGVRNVVSSSGTSLTKEQIRLIGRYTKNITVLYDGDAAGIKASFRGIDLILEHDLDVHAVVFPEGEDPDSFSRSMSSEAFQQFLKDNAQDFIRFKIGILANNISELSGEEKSEIIRQMIESLSMIKDEVKRSEYIRSTSEILKANESSILIEVNHKILTRLQGEKRKRENEKHIEEQIEELVAIEPSDGSSFFLTLVDLEKECLRLLLNYGNETVADGVLAEVFFRELEGFEFESKICSIVFNQSNIKFQNSRKIELDDFLSSNDSNIKMFAVDALEIKYFISDGWFDLHRISTSHESEDLYKQSIRAVLRLKKRKLEIMIRDNEDELRNNWNEESIKVYMELKRRHTIISKELGTVVNL